MEVIINGNKYDISYIDTEDSIREMIAMKERVLPKFIKIISIDKGAKNIVVENLASILSGVDYNGIKEFINTHPEYTPTDIATEWLRVRYPKGVTISNSETMRILREIDSTTFGGVGPDGINNRLHNYLREIDDDLERLRINAISLNQFKNAYKKYKPVETTRFVNDSVNVEYTGKVTTDALGLFNSINLTPELPFVRLNTSDGVFYKVYEGITPIESWMIGDETLTYRIPSTDALDDWETITGTFDGELLRIVISAKIITGTKKSNADELKAQFLRTIAGSGVTLSDTAVVLSINGVFGLPNLAVSRDVLYYLISNDSYVSNYLYIDETGSISKKTMRIFYSTEINKTSSYKPLVFSLSQKNATKFDIMNISGVLPLFTPYLSVRMSKFRDEAQIADVKNAIALIFDIYLDKYAEISRKYSSVIPKFNEEQKVVKTREQYLNKNINRLQDAIPDLFISDPNSSYGKKCGPEKQPLYLTHGKELDRYRAEGKSILNYPYNSNHFFVCDYDRIDDKGIRMNSRFIYPSLIVNELSNKKKYKYLPCCLIEKNDAENEAKTKAEYDNTRAPDKRSSKTKAGNYVSIDKKCTFGQFGLLAKNVYYVVTRATGTKKEYLRTGVDVSNNSFIAAVLLARDSKFKNDPKYISDFRQNLASVDIGVVAAEMYGITVEEYTADILSDSIFDSKQYINLLQVVLDCNIFVFTIPNSRSNGEFEVPNYAKGYLYTNTKRPTVLIYKHMGRLGGDGLTSPHYELIIERDANSRIQRNFINDASVVTIREYFCKQYQLYIFGVGKYTPYTPLPELVKGSIGHIMDEWGKTRGVVYDNNIHIITSPIAGKPGMLKVPEPETRPAAEAVYAFLRNRNITISAQDVMSDGKNIRGFLLDIPGILYAYAPVAFSPIITRIPTDVNLGYLTKCTGDVLASNNLHKKTADFLMQYILYSFSIWYEKYTRENPLNTNEGTLANKLVNERAYLLNAIKGYANTIVIKSTHVYALDSISREMTLNNTFFTNGALIVTSTDMRDKLVYYLRHAVTGDRYDYVIRAKDYKYLNNYYTSPTDFTPYLRNEVYIGDIALTNWIAGVIKQANNITPSVPDQSSAELFFYKHYAINGGVPVIIQNVHGNELHRAINVATEFAISGINTGFKTEPIAAIGYDNIQAYYFDNNVIKSNGNGDIKLWQYDTNEYAAILSHS